MKLSVTVYSYVYQILTFNHMLCHLHMHCIVLKSATADLRIHSEGQGEGHRCRKYA